MALGDAAAAYLTEKTPQALYDLRVAVQAQPSYSSHSNHLAHATALLGASEYERAMEVLQQGRPGAFLSPSGHALLARALRAAGDREIAELEEQLAWLAMRAILESGDGSRERPYIVLRISDEYDALAVLDKTIVRQHLEAYRRRTYDVFDLTDGSETCFEIFHDGVRGAL